MKLNPKNLFTLSVPQSKSTTNLLYHQGYFFILQIIALILPLNGIISALVGGGLILTFTFRHPRNLLNAIEFNPLSWTWVVLSAWIIITSITSYNLSNSLLGVTRYIPFFLFCIISTRLLDSRDRIIRLLWLLILASLITGGFGMIQAYLDRPDWHFLRLFQGYTLTFGFSEDIRIKSLFGHANETAIFLLMLLPITIHITSGRVQQLGFSSRMIAALATGLSFTTLILTGSRNASMLVILAFFVSSLIYKWWWIALSSLTSFTVVVWGLFGSYVGLGGEWVRSFLPTGWVNRMISTVDSQFDVIAYGSAPAQRMHVWNLALSLIKEKPFTGWGFNNFTQIIYDRGEDLVAQGFPHEHNIYLALAVGSGIPMLLGFVGLIMWALYRAIAQSFDRELALIIGLAVVLGMLSGFSDLVFFEPRVNLLFYILIAILFALPISLSSKEIDLPR